MEIISTDKHVSSACENGGHKRLQFVTMRNGVLVLACRLSREVVGGMMLPPVYVWQEITGNIQWGAVNQFCR